MSELNKLTLDAIVSMSDEERSLLTEKDYNHLKTTDKMQAKILVQQSSKLSNPRRELMNNTNKNESNNGSVNVSNSTSVREIAKRIKEVNQKRKKPKFEETHKKDNFWLKNELHKALNDICIERGDKTRIINEALFDYFKKLEKQI